MTEPTTSGGDIPAAPPELTEAERLLAAITYFAPSASVTVESFTKAHDRACVYLASRAAEGATISPNEMAAVAWGDA